MPQHSSTTKPFKRPLHTSATAAAGLAQQGQSAAAHTRLTAALAAGVAFLTRNCKHHSRKNTRTTPEHHHALHYSNRRADESGSMH